MQMLMHIGNFVLTEWIWSITTVSWYLPFNILLSFLFFKLWDNLSWIRALSLSIFLSIGAFLILFGMVHFIGVKLLGFEFVLPQDTYTGNYNILNASLVLAAIYSGIKAGMLAIINYFTRIHYITALLCVITADFLTAFLVYKITFTL